MDDKALNFQSISKLCLIMASVVIILTGIKAATVIVVPILLALFIAIICQPLILWFHQRGFPKSLAVIAVMALVMVVLTGLTSLVMQSFNEFISKLPDYRQQMTGMFSAIAELARSYNVPLEREFLQSQLDPSRAVTIAVNMLSGVGGFMTSSIIILLIVVFMLAEASIMPEKIRQAFPDSSKPLKNAQTLLQVINKYLALKTAISAVTGLVIGVALWLLGIDHYLLWGVLAFLLNFIPNIGSIIAAVPAVLLAFIQAGPAMAGVVTLLFVAVNMVMGNLIEPRVMGRGLGLSTLIVFLSLIFWGFILGPVGMLLSVPLTMTVKIALQENDDTRWLAILLSGDEILKTADKTDEVSPLSSSAEKES